jgi:hypothetical protein
MPGSTQIKTCKYQGTAPVRPVFRYPVAVIFAFVATRYGVLRNTPRSLVARTKISRLS